MVGLTVFARVQWQPQEPVLTLYVTTPASSLTLTRRWSEIVDLDARVSSHPAFEICWGGDRALTAWFTD